ncbi:MAG TPA: hypothetical protein DC058_19765 [Planctomycetaceae bacterium]|nr:hypothetical protein [Planctomycetaceae bacterium]HBC63434.1 hypothetical protein [Planctomycetaceae bacterium]
MRAERGGDTARGDGQMQTLFRCDLDVNDILFFGCGDASTGQQGRKWGDGEGGIDGIGSPGGVDGFDDVCPRFDFDRGQWQNDGGGCGGSNGGTGLFERDGL